MKILMLLYQFFNSDTRVKREARILAQNNFKIEVFNLKKPKSEKIVNEISGLNIKNHGIMQVDPKKRQSFFLLIKFWILAFFNIIKLKYIPEVIHAHDLTGLPPAILYKMIHHKVKVIYDSHELFPEAAKDKLNVLYWLIFLMIEIFCCKFIDLLIGASPLQLKFLKQRIRKPQICLLNVPDLESIKREFNYEKLNHHPLNTNKEKKVRVVYSGGVYPFRGYDEFVLSASKIINKSSNFEFWIIGDGIYLSRVKNLVKKEGLTKYFRFTGEVRLSKLLELTYNCDIAVGLYENIDNNNIMISNKIFEYMLVGIPFLFTSLRSSKPYIEKVNAVEIDFPLDPEIIAQNILYLSNNKKLQNEISIKSRNLVQKQLNWKNESAKLVTMYSEVLK